MERLTSHEISELNDINENTKQIALGMVIQGLIDGLTDVVKTGTPVNTKKAGVILSVTGTVHNGEVVIIDDPAAAGSDIYEFVTSVDKIKTNPANKAVDIEAHTAHAYTDLTVDVQPTSGETLTIGDRVYTFVPNGTATANGEISIGTDLATVQANIVNAINGTDAYNIAHNLVRAAAFAANVCRITAIYGGTNANTIATTETMASLNNAFSDATLTGGTDCTAANAILELVAAITASDTQNVSAADGDGDTITISAKIGGVAGNSIAITESLTNGSLSGATLSGGVDGTAGKQKQIMADANYLYICTADNSKSDSNWRRISVGSAY